ncbi:MAG: DUF4394 domain-containing protein, partial [Proteobacteria bacterium]
MDSLDLLAHRRKRSYFNWKRKIMPYVSLSSRACIVAALLAAICVGFADSVRAELIYGATDSSDLVSFDSATPGTLTTIGAFSGLPNGQTIRGIDFRPATGQLYALSTSTPTPVAGTTAQLYTTDLVTGALTAVGNRFTLASTTGLNAVASLDFNPVDDTIRVVTGGGLNYHFNPVTGAMISRDTDINPTGIITDIAYSNNTIGATSTTLYAYNYSTNMIGTVGSVGGSPNSPNSGQFTPIGSSGWFSNDATVGFDISGATGIGYINTNITGAARDALFRVNLGTGAMTNIGNKLDIDV